MLPEPIIHGDMEYYEVKESGSEEEEDPTKIEKRKSQQEPYNDGRAKRNKPSTSSSRTPKRNEYSRSSRERSSNRTPYQRWNPRPPTSAAPSPSPSASTTPSSPQRRRSPTYNTPNQVSSRHTCHDKNYKKPCSKCQRVFLG